jgi:hypothetical protein
MLFSEISRKKILPINPYMPMFYYTSGFKIMQPIAKIKEK